MSRPLAPDSSWGTRADFLVSRQWSIARVMVDVDVPTELGGIISQPKGGIPCEFEHPTTDWTDDESIWIWINI